MQIKILGSGCANCANLEKVTREAAESINLSAEFEKVTEMADIMAYGVMTTPALVVDDKVKLAGRVPSVEEVAEILKGATSTEGGCGCAGGCC